jgi:hypothetical protein
MRDFEFRVDCEFSCLFQYIHFENLSPDFVKLFISCISEFFHFLNVESWFRICSRLLQPEMNEGNDDTFDSEGRIR